MRCAALSALLALLAATAAGAARAAPRAVYTSLDRVHACAAGGGGALLLGTRGGLALLDRRGRLRRRLTALDGLAGTEVFALRWHAGLLWVGGEGGLAALVRREDGGWRRRLLLRGPAVRALAVYRGALIVGSWGKGVARYERRARRLRYLGGPRRVTALRATPAALLIASAGNGVWVARGARRPSRLRVALPSAYVFSLARVGTALLAGTLAGVAQLTLDGRGAARAVPRARVDARALLPLAGGALLAGSYGRGLLRLPRRPGRSASRVALPRAVRHVNVIARLDASVCVGTRRGAFLLGGRGRRPRALRFAGPSANNITALARDAASSRLYVGTFDGGLSVLDSRAPAGRRWRRLSGVDARIDALTLTRAGGAATLWAGTPRGLYRLRGGRVRRFGRADGMRHEHVHALAALGGGTLVAGTARGLVLVRGDRVEAVNVKHGLPVAAVWSIGVARDRTLWLGTSKGLIHFDPRRRRRRRYSVVSGHLPDDWVTAVLVHRAQIYVGTYNAGVARLTRASDGRMTATRLGGGWINISGLLVRGGALYAATMRGLRVRPLAGAGRFRLLRSAAPGRDVTALLDAGSAGLWVGSRRGLALR